MYQRAFCIFGPQCLFLTLHVISNYFIGRLKNIFCGTIILLQTDDNSFLKYTFKAENISNVRTTEFVNRLVVVSYDTEISVFGRQKADQLKLCGVGVLILIHHNVTESLLILIQHIRAGTKQLYRLHNQIVKIKCIVFVKLLLIFAINFCNSLLMNIAAAVSEKFIRSH